MKEFCNSSRIEQYFPEVIHLVSCCVGIKLHAYRVLHPSVFGLLSSAVLIFTGDSSAHSVAHTQPMKLAAMEGLYKGREGTGFSMFGILTPGKEYGDDKDAFVFNIEFPKLLSFLGYRNFNAFVPELMI